ncbi:hypothetical protein GDO81_016631 [Engystomops pustulosus]|uniref:Uncharacterized protein n=1 Tax=Engystomops pustulosus TaxID=76066 RepID=A0AAV7ABY5_ENGPU|nr:hypothetical protein GDO81_016631 [Engystomops pustulosus]
MVGRGLFVLAADGAMSMGETCRTLHWGLGALPLHASSAPLRGSDGQNT